MNSQVSNRPPKRMRIVFVLFVLLPIPVLAQASGTFAEPDSALLFGRNGSSLYLVTPAKIIELKNVKEGGARGTFRAPSLARTLDRIAWSVEKGDHTAIGVYTVHDQTWKSFADICYAGGGPAAFSPDGTKIAFVAVMPLSLVSVMRSPPIHDVCPLPEQTVLQIFDLATGKITKLHAAAGRCTGASAGRPMGRRLPWSTRPGLAWARSPLWRPIRERPEPLLMADILRGRRKATGLPISICNLRCVLLFTLTGRV